MDHLCFMFEKFSSPDNQQFFTVMCLSSWISIGSAHMCGKMEELIELDVCALDAYIEIMNSGLKRWVMIEKTKEFSVALDKALAEDE